MPPPNDSFLPTGVEVHRLPNGKLEISPTLADLLITSRTNYAWPEGTGAAQSQITIIELEKCVAGWVEAIDSTNAQRIIKEVSTWGGNNANAQGDIETAAPEVQIHMLNAIRYLMNPIMLKRGLDELSNLPGLRLVMATKVYRFCCPNEGAAIDRHASYFFNSLEIVESNSNCSKSTNFRREWSTGSRKTSRLAIYTPAGHRVNRNEFVGVYLRLMVDIANSLNESGKTYRCAVTDVQEKWRPADVEMAAYYWWAHNSLSR